MGRVLQPFEYVKPTTIAEAIRLTTEPGADLIAGGCELVLSMRRGKVQPARLVSVLDIPGLNVFSAHPKIGIEIGASVKINRLARDIWISKRWAALHEAIDQLHPPHIRNMGTVVGNVCSAIPYTDIPPALMALRAVVHLESASGPRAVPIDQFYTGPRTSVAGAGDFVTKIVVPPPGSNASSAFRKIYKAPRREGDLHKVNAAAAVVLDEEGTTIQESTIVVGCCGPAPYRIYDAEKAIAGQSATTATYSHAADLATHSLRPMTDAAWVEETRAEFVRVLVRDVLEHAAARARMKHDHLEHHDDLLGE
jgi:aerobic carbon-monoxide dehydrogenase medium subunit